ncbi:STN domain-containing protein [Bradyrhizobium roseum]|uniref:STN domain-containing protein n=1 Tax=Bradyrhizobium roseum TaxID=3056648 RepID=UPI002629522B|nr:STN domain-containing protein [Bradyrhizobium roseus]WKA26113.1 STN domain-containing protein [Bradyrhizobium roseus]
MSRATLLLGVLAVSMPAAAQERSQHGQASAPSQAITFDIPAQPLASALQSFGRLTQLELFYESSLMIDRRSSLVRGDLAPDAALRLLLKGTGFTIASFSRGTITILPPMPTSAAELAQIKRKAGAFTPYLALLQLGLRSVFCRQPDLLVEKEELLVRLRIGPSGVVSFAELLSSTGSPQHDLAYLSALRSLSVGEPPPAAMPQPVTLMILPRDQRQVAECAAPGTRSPSVAHD